jgi:hypothetical protein
LGIGAFRVLAGTSSLRSLSVRFVDTREPHQLSAGDQNAITDSKHPDRAALGFEPQQARTNTQDVRSLVDGKIQLPNITSGTLAVAHEYIEAFEAIARERVRVLTCCIRY